MTDDLVKRLRENWITDKEALQVADRIEALTAERDGLLRCVTDNHVALCRAEAAEAERDRLREALNQSRLAFAGYVSVQSAIDLIDRAALKGEQYE